MTKRRGNIEVEETFLRSVALPEATDTYTVIAHGTIIDKVRTELKKNGFNITGEKYIASVDGEMALGKLCGTPITNVLSLVVQLVLLFMITKHL
jgi:hypothetical protein